MAMKKSKGYSTPKLVEQDYSQDEPDMQEVYDTCMAEVYDIFMEAYDKVGVKVKEMLDDYYPEYDVELDDDNDDDEYIK